MTPKRPRKKDSTRKRSTPSPLERAVPLWTANELLPYDEAAEERRRLLDDSRLRDRRREVSDAVLPVRDVPEPDVYASDDLLYEPEPEHDRIRDAARADLEDRGKK